MSKIAFYIRKSTEDDNHQMLSLEAQTSSLKALLAHRREDVQDKNIYCECKSAGEPNKRPLFNELIQRVKDGEIDTIYTWDWDRLTRNMYEGGVLSQLIFDKQLTVITPKQIYNDDTDALVPAVWTAQATEGRKRLIASIKRGIETKVSKGLYNWRAPNGYINVGKNKGECTIAPDSNKGPLVIQLFKIASKQYSLKQLVAYADKINLRSNRYQGKEKPLTKNSIYFILTNPVYYGVFRYKGELHKGTFSPLISQELWNRVQEAIHEKNKPYTKGLNLPFRRLLKCAGCGSAITATLAKGEYTYNHCSKRKNNKCNQPYIKPKELDEQFIKHIRKISITKQRYTEGMAYLHKRHDDQMAVQHDITKALQHEEDTINQRTDRLLNLLLDGGISQDKYKSKTKEIESALKSVQARRKVRDENSLNWLEQADTLLKLVVDVEKIYKMANQEEKEQLIQLFGWNLKLDNKKLVWEYKKPFSLIAQKEGGMNWWTLPDSNR